MAKWNIDDREIDRQIADAEEATREAAKREPRAEEAYYDSNTKSIVVTLNTGAYFSFPFYLGEGLIGARPEQLSRVEITPLGDGLRWRELDVTLDLAGLMMGIYGTRAWMAQMGRIGGQVTSEAKATAARINGMKGGRPSKEKSKKAFSTRSHARTAASRSLSPKSVTNQSLGSKSAASRSASRTLSKHSKSRSKYATASKKK